jgi:hypothetical protein
LKVLSVSNLYVRDLRSGQACGKIKHMTNTETATTTSKKMFAALALSMLGAAILYLPCWPLLHELSFNLRTNPTTARYTPEAGFLPFLSLYWGALVALFLYSRPARNLTGSLQQGILSAAGGAVVYGLMLTVLARGWEGFVRWFDPALWLMALALALYGLFSGAVLGALKYWLARKS